jgi:serine protease Do
MVDQFARSLVVVRTSSTTELGVVAPGGEFVIALSSKLQRGQEVSLSARDRLQEWRAARVVGVDPRSGIAAIEPPPPNLQPVAVGDSGNLVNGQPLVEPLGMSGRISARLVAVANTQKTLARVLSKAECGPPFVFVEMIAEASAPEVSGPVFDLQGRLVAFGSLYLRPPRSVPLYANFGYPANTLLQIATSVRRYGYWKRARIGIVTQEITPELAATFGMPNPTGVLVHNAEPGSPADKAGLRSADVILAINGQGLARSCQLMGQLANWLPGDLLRLTVWRQRAEIEISVRAAEFPQK